MTLLLIVAYLLTVFLRLGLVWLNLRHRALHAGRVPPELGAAYDQATLRASLAYARDRERLELVRIAVTAVIVLAWLFGGGLSAYDDWTRRMSSSAVPQAILFFVGLQLAVSLLELGWDAIATFLVEKRHGFNKTTAGLFLQDAFKSALIGALLVAVVAAGGMALFEWTPSWYWLWFWGFAAVFSILLILIAPIVIEPLFIKTSPLADQELAHEVQQLAQKASVRVSAVLQSDASRRTAHSNAYFTGIGPVKRVVLFDTLLERLEPREVLAVLAHELGHTRLKHVPRRLYATALVALVALFAASRVLDQASLFSALGLGQASVSARVVLVGFVGSIIGFLATPLSTYLSRRQEWQADRFAAKLTQHPEDLSSALVKLARDNRADPNPHPVTSAFYDSHPRVHQRVVALRSTR